MLATTLLSIRIGVPTTPTVRPTTLTALRMCADCWLATSRELTLLPFDVSEVMLPGETKELVFKEAHDIIQLECCYRKYRAGCLASCCGASRMRRWSAPRLCRCWSSWRSGSTALWRTALWVCRPLVKCVGRVTIRGEVFRNDGDGFDRARAMPYTDEDRRPEETDEVDRLLEEASMKQMIWRELDARRAARILGESCATLGGSRPDSAGALSAQKRIVPDRRRCE